MGFPVDMFTVLFAIPRMSGWLAHWDELLGDKDQKISRPRQWYTGVDERDYVASATAEEGPAVPNVPATGEIVPFPWRRDRSAL